MERMGDTNEAQQSMERRQLWDNLWSYWTEEEFSGDLTPTPNEWEHCSVEGQLAVICKEGQAYQSEQVKGLTELDGLVSKLCTTEVMTAAGVKEETEDEEEEMVGGSAFWRLLGRVGYTSW